MRIGCLGLAANPPHFAHVEAAKVLLRSGFFDEIWLIVTYEHAFRKSDMASWEHRLEMCRILERQNICVCGIEQELEKPSYTINTLMRLRAKLPEHSFDWCIGSDIITTGSYKNWHRWKELGEKEKIFVVERPGYVLIAEMPDCFVVMGETPEPISSTEIRRMVREGKNITPYVGEEVARYIEKHKLYNPPSHKASEGKGR